MLCFVVAFLQRMQFFTYNIAPEGFGLQFHLQDAAFLRDDVFLIHKLRLNKQGQTYQMLFSVSVFSRYLGCDVILLQSCAIHEPKVFDLFPFCFTTWYIFICVVCESYSNCRNLLSFSNALECDILVQIIIIFLVCFAVLFFQTQTVHATVSIFHEEIPAVLLW